VNKPQEHKPNKKSVRIHALKDGMVIDFGGMKHRVRSASTDGHLTKVRMAPYRDGAYYVQDLFTTRAISASLVVDVVAKGAPIQAVKRVYL
jgi:hypothetical protein